MPPCGKISFSVKQQKAHCHHEHAQHQSVYRPVRFAVFPRRRKELVEGDEHHDAGNRAHEYADEDFVKKNKKKPKGNQRADRFGNT